MSSPAVLYQAGTHASRPANGSGCVLYSCTTHNLVYRDDGTSWTTFMTLVGGSGGDIATDVIWDAKGDLAGGTGANSAARLAAGSNGQVLVADSSQSTGLKWGVPALVGCSLYNSADEAISTSGEGVVTMNSEYYDTDAFHDTSSNTGRVTIPSGKAGKYLFVVSLRASISASSMYAVLRKNAAANIVLNIGPAPVSTVGSITMLHASVVLDLAVGDYIELKASSAGAGNIIAPSTNAGPWLQATLLGT